MSAGETTLFAKKAPSVQVRAKNSDVATCQDASLLLGYNKKLGDVYQQETVKKVYAGS